MQTDEIGMAGPSSRAAVIEELRRELFGPSPAGKTIDTDAPLQFDSFPDSFGPWIQQSGEEILDRDSPIKRFGVGVLFPKGALLNEGGEAEIDDDSIDDDPESLRERDIGEVEVTGSDLGANDVAVDPSLTLDVESLGVAEDDDLDLSRANVYQPSVLGVSFLAELRAGSRLVVNATGGRYVRKLVTVGASGTRARPRFWWLRHSVELEGTFSKEDLEAVRIQRPAVWVTGHEGLPPMDLWFEVYSRPWMDGHDQRLITLCLVNRSEAPGRGNPSEWCLFQTHFTAEVASIEEDASILPYPRFGVVQDEEEQSLALLYRTHPTFATGHGCAADWQHEIGIPRARSVSAECLPVIEVPNTTADITENEDSDKQVAIDMAALAGLRRGDDGMASMERVINLYEQWLGRQGQKADGLPGEFRDAARRHLDDCWAAASRMRDGLAYLRQDSRALRAFQLANYAMLLQQINASRPRRDIAYEARQQRYIFSSAYDEPAPLAPPKNRGSWRAFQIGFLLASLRSAVAGDAPDRNTVELIWFPTGGGKTEAYLGLAAFAMFKRRLDDASDAGVHVLMRYTLRLLTAQQFQRASGLICAMEWIRRSLDLNLGTQPFRVGIWLGGETTPNRRADAVAAWRDLKGPRGGENRFLLMQCPWCAAEFGRREAGSGKQRQVLTPGYERRRTADGRDETVVFTCPDAACPFHAELPVAVVDEDIYEQRPTLLIGTIDKFAMLAWRPEAAALFGIGIEGERFCSPPGLIIQDELHLISGPLGSLAGLYEAVIEELCTDHRTDSHALPKIVCSTATIRRFKSQALGLYGRDEVALFPPPELDAGVSFFAREQFPGRTFVGVHAPSLGSVQTEWVRTFTSLFLAPMALPEGARDPWWTMVVFFNSLREMGTAHTLFDTDVRDYAKVIWNRKGIGSPSERRYVNRLFELIGGLRSEEINAAIGRLETRYSAQDNSCVDVCLASNVIEVGIDIQRLALIVIAGQPKTTSQYIQVSGRVGRNPETPGLVVTMYSPSKPRDRSHFERFRSYHQQLYAQVEPSSVTPYSEPALDRALHAVLTAYVRQAGGVKVAWSPYPYPKELVERFETVLLNRVVHIDPEEEDALRRVLARRIEEWTRWKRTHWTRNRPEDDIAQLRYAGSYASLEEARLSWPTPTSMRNVDAECETRITGLYLTGGEQ